ncbi:MAG TPA: DUF202 domain-containing protein [Pirellulales bacterium]|jgi:putative membrane protein
MQAQAAPEAALTTGTPPVDPRNYMAAERTLLAWIRTGLAMMGFGFVVARFGLFMRELMLAREVEQHRSYSASMIVGTTLVVFGVLVTFSAAVKHRKTVDRLSRGELLIARPVSLGSVVAVLLGLLGLAMAVVLAYEISTS